MCCCARERTAGPLIHTHTHIISLYLSRSVYTNIIYARVCVIYTHIIHTLFLLDPLSSSRSDNMCPKILFRFAEESKRNASRTGLTTITINTIPTYIHGAPARLTMFIQTVCRRRVTRAHTRSSARWRTIGWRGGGWAGY